MIIKPSQLMLAAIIICLLAPVSPTMFCFIKTSPTPNKAQKQSSIIQIKQSQLRSYHPHYLSSLTYPSPMTPHLYFAEVVGVTPIIFMNNHENWDPNSLEKITVNGVTYQDKSAKAYPTHRQESFRSIFTIQMENVYPDAKSYSIHLLKRKEHYLVTCEYEGKLNAFAVYLTSNNIPLPLSPEKLRGLKINIRNESLGDARSNWRFSQSLTWKGVNTNYDSLLTEVSGLVIEIQCIDKKVKKDLRLNVQELSNPQNLDFQAYVEREKKIDFASLIPSAPTIVAKNNNCSNAAAQKIFQGLSYEYGTLKIKDGPTAIANLPQSLLSFSPSRKRFPWGFLWDDGFHCEVAVRRDEALTYKVIKSWLDTMLENGWIPRQQNRGAERQQLCNCPRFMEKDIKDGNPPTLILALEHLQRSNKLNITIFPVSYWNKIKKWYNWFLNTQRDDQQFLFRWKDSINQGGASFTSGMDDFPRPFNCKANVDLQAWLYFFTDFMIQAAPIYSESVKEYKKNKQFLRKNFELMLEPRTNVYKDISYDGLFSEHFGYPNILPLAFGVPAYHSKEYNATIAMIKEHLDIGAGLASISKHSRHYLQNNDAYWKGPVWININYLFLRGLKLYYPQQKQLYSKLRKDLMNTVCGNWQQSGFFFQNYKQGKGSFSFPFNGWTSLISIIIDENY